MVKQMNKFILFTLLSLLFFGSVYSQDVRTANLFSKITAIKNAMPGRDSYDFVVPTSAQQDIFAAIINLILSDQYQLADSLAEYLNYSLFEWYDTGNSNHLYYLLMENGADISGGVQYGWGTYIFNPTGYDEVIIEVPHPRWDTNTWQVGFKAYQYLDTKHFLMAGTHRYANGSNPAPADVAHNTQNMFHIVHQKVSPVNTHSLQVHGFSRNNHPNYPDVVLSNGSSSPPLIIDSLANSIINHGYSVGIYDGINWSQLGATTNKQGQWSRSQGYSFIHMELEYFIRTAQSEWENILDALKAVFLTPLGIDYETNIYLPDHYVLKQNYPNPFNASTKIEYHLGSSQDVQLNIYNITGQLINTLVNSTQPVGNHFIIWNGKDINNQSVSSGVYFYRLKINNKELSKKMMLLQ
jgi:hypothetical protein